MLSQAEGSLAVSVGCARIGMRDSEENVALIHKQTARNPSGGSGGGIQSSKHRPGLWSSQVGNCLRQNEISDHAERDVHNAAADEDGTVPVSPQQEVQAATIEATATMPGIDASFTGS